VTARAVKLKVFASVPKDCSFWLEDDSWNGVCEELLLTLRGSSFEDAKAKMEAELQAHIESILRNILERGLPDKRPCEVDTPIRNSDPADAQFLRSPSPPGWPRCPRRIRRSDVFCLRHGGRAPFVARRKAVLWRVFIIVAVDLRRSPVLMI